MSRVFWNPLYHNETDPKANVMDKWERQGKTYRYVKVVDLATVAGDVLIYTATEGVVTKDYTGGTAHVGCVAGVALGVISAGSYGIIQTGGYCPTVNVDAACVAGSALVTPNTADGRADIYDAAGAYGEAMAQNAANVFAKALAADAANVAPAMLYCP